MAKKNFKPTLSERKYVTIVNQKDQKQEEPQKTADITEAATKEAGNANYKPRSLKIREDVLEKLQALAWWNRQSMQELFTDIIENHVSSVPETELNDIMKSYKK